VDLPSPRQGGTFELGPALLCEIGEAPQITLFDEIIV
jgi:hypothetical protein